MTTTTPVNPFGQAPAAPVQTTPAPVVIAPTTNPTVVDQGALDQAAAFAAFQAAQAAAAAPVAPAVPPAPPGVDPAQWAAFQAAQHGAPVAPVTPVAPAAPVFTPPPAAPASADPFDDPAPQRPRGPRPLELYGRLVLIIPKELEKVASNDPEKPAGTMVDRLTADVVVLDGGPISFGGKPEALPPIPHNRTEPLPYRQAAMYLSAVGIISQCRDALDKRKRGEPGMVIGRVMTGEQKDPRKKPPYLLAKATDADRQIARGYLATIDPFA